ncbi:Atherin [Schistosoma japonicum]|nr:Atherin [Schistosoma japonicum]
MTTISPPFLSFPLSQGLPLPPLFSSTSNLSHDFTNAQLTIPVKPDGMLTSDSFIADMDCGRIDRQEEKDDPVCFCCGGLPTCEEAFLICKDCGLHENSKDVNQFENGTQCNSKATVFKHEPRKRKSQNHNGATIVLMNSTCQASSSSLFSNVSNDVTSKSDAKSTLSFNQESRSVFTSTTTAPIQLLLPSHNLVTHVATSTLNRSKCKVNRASVSSDTVRKSIGVALRPILPNHLRKYPNTLLLNTRLGLKSICDTATIQSIHHIRPDFKRIPNHNNSFTQDHRQNIAFALCESSDEDRNIDLISKNKLSVFKSSIIASKSDNTITSTNAPSVIIPSPVIDILPYNSPSQFIAANLTYMNTVFYSSPEEDFLWESQFFGKKDGRQLIYTIIYLFAKLLNLRKSHQLHQLNSGSNSQLQLIYFDDNHNDDEVRDSSIKMANSHPTLNSDLQNLSNIYMIGKDRNSSLIYRPDPSCFTLPNSSVTTSRMPSSTTATVTNMSDQKSHSYFDYLDENSPQDYTMKQNAKKERKLLTSPGFNFILDHNAVKNHERCIVCYHEFYMSKRQSSTDQSFESKYFLTWRTNCATRSLWFSCYPIGPTQLATILRKIEFTLAHTAVRIQQQKQHTINLSSIDLPLNQNLIKSTSSMLSRVKNELNFNLCSGSNTPLDLVMRNSENETGNTNSANDWILEKANGERQTDTTHPTCLDYWPELTERARQSPWQCSDCKTCTICNNNQYKSDLIVCDACDKGFHVECHQPKLEESIDRSLPWVCTNCQDEGYRVAIGTLPSSANHQNYSTPNKIKDLDDSGKTPLKEINSSHEYVKPELKHETDESSCIEENIIKSVESSLHSTTVCHNLETNTSNTLCNENIPVDANPTSHSSFILSPTKSCSRTPSKLNDSTSNSNNTNEINSAQLKEESLHEYKSESTKNLTDNNNKASSVLRNSTSDLHLRSCIDDNDKHGSNNNDTVNTVNNNNNKEIKNEIENTNESNTVNGENHEGALTNNRPTDVSIWSVDHVQHWLLEEGFPREAEAFYQQEIDGTCLLLMKRMDVLTELGIKLGPAVKIYERIKRFQSQCGSPT